MATGSVRTVGVSVTIYDVPVDDTVFFPVSGDMMRQMKHDEDERLRKQNGTRDAAKNSALLARKAPRAGLEGAW